MNELRRWRLARRLKPRVAADLIGINISALRWFEQSYICSVETAAKIEAYTGLNIMVVRIKPAMELSRIERLKMYIERATLIRSI